MKIGDNIQRFKSCSSTNDMAKELAARGAPEGTVIISEEQTQGRGRLNRTWHSPPGKGLYLSVLLCPLQPDISLLTLVAGVAVSEALWKALAVRVCLKWPNDLLWDERKLGGILCESSFTGNRLNHVVLGIGLNVGHKEADFPEDIRNSATSLRLITDRDISQDVLLSCLWETLDDGYTLFMQDQTEKILSAFMKHSCYSPEQRLVVETDCGPVLGRYKGIDSQGGLILETREGARIYFAADIQSLREAKENGHAISHRHREHEYRGRCFSGRKTRPALEDPFGEGKDV